MSMLIQIYAISKEPYVDLMELKSQDEMEQRVRNLESWDDEDEWLLPEVAGLLRGDWRTDDAAQAAEIIVDLAGGELVHDGWQWEWLEELITVLSKNKITEEIAHLLSGFLYGRDPSGHVFEEGELDNPAGYFSSTEIQSLVEFLESNLEELDEELSSEGSKGLRNHVLPDLEDAVESGDLVISLVC